MHFAIRFLTEYRYDTPVTDNLNALRVRPATTSTQRCDEFHTGIEPEARVGRHLDYFGTEVIEFGIPTNHLDLDSVHWLQDYLTYYQGALIVISHDRHFLNSVCTHVADIDYETVIMYTGGYDDMVLAKTQIRSRIEAQNQQREKKIAQL